MEAMRSLAYLGHPRIALSAYGTEICPGRQARAGFADAMRDLDLEGDQGLVMTIADLNLEAGGVVAEKIIAAKPTAAVWGTHILACAYNSSSARAFRPSTIPSTLVGCRYWRRGLGRCS